MREGCECSYCQENVNEYFCIKCGHNFNECEVFHKFERINLCPVCQPKDWSLPKKPISLKISQLKIMNCMSEDEKLKLQECLKEIEQEEEYLIDQHGHKWVKDMGEK